MAAKQLELDFSYRSHRRAVIDDCKRLAGLHVIEGTKRINLNACEAKVLLQKIAEYDVCFMSMPMLAEEAGISERNVKRLLKAMQAEGLLSIEKHAAEKGHFPCNRYVVFYSELSLKICPPQATPQATPRATVAHNLYIDRKKETTTTESPWDVVVVALENVGVGQAAKAAAKAQERGRLPDDVLAQIASLKGSSPGVIFNQVCYPTPKAVTIARPKPMRVESREQKRHRVFMALRERLGRVPFENEIEECLA